jgi:hypothetical protein
MNFDPSFDYTPLPPARLAAPLSAAELAAIPPAAYRPISRRLQHRLLRVIDFLRIEQKMSLEIVAYLRGIDEDELTRVLLRVEQPGAAIYSNLHKFIAIAEQQMAREFA